MVKEVFLTSLFSSRNASVGKVTTQSIHISHVSALGRFAWEACEGRLPKRDADWQCLRGGFVAGKCTIAELKPPAKSRKLAPLEEEPRTQSMRSLRRERRQREFCPQRSVHDRDRLSGSPGFIRRRRWCRTTPPKVHEAFVTLSLSTQYM